MSALTERLTEVLRAHRMTAGFRHDLGEFYCNCGAWMTDHAAHVAERVEAALGLTEETKRYVPENGAQDQRRWVSPWEPATDAIQRDFDVAKAAAQAAVAASKNTGRTVDPRVKALADGVRQER